MLQALCIIAIGSGLCTAISAWVIAGQVNRLIAFVLSEPQAHPIRRYFERLTKRKTFKATGLSVRA